MPDRAPSGCRPWRAAAEAQATGTPTSDGPSSASMPCSGRSRVWLIRHVLDPSVSFHAPDEHFLALPSARVCHGPSAETGPKSDQAPLKRTKSSSAWTPEPISGNRPSKSHGRELFRNAASWPSSMRPPPAAAGPSAPTAGDAAPPDRSHSSDGPESRALWTSGLTGRPLGAPALVACVLRLSFLRARVRLPCAGTQGACRGGGRTRMVHPVSAGS